MFCIIKKLSDQRITRQLKATFLFLSVLFLTSCTADRIEIGIKASELNNATLGSSTSVPFTVIFPWTLSGASESEEQFSRLKKVFRDSFDLTGFELKHDVHGEWLEIKGYIPLLSPIMDDGEYIWAILVQPNDIAELNELYPNQLVLETGKQFDYFKQSIKAVNEAFLFSNNQPITLKIEADSQQLTILTGSIELLGRNSAIEQIHIVSGTYEEFTFSNGVNLKTDVKALFRFNKLSH